MNGLGVDKDGRELDRGHHEAEEEEAGQERTAKAHLGGSDDDQELDRQTREHTRPTLAQGPHLTYHNASTNP